MDNLKELTSSFRFFFGCKTKKLIQAVAPRLASRGVLVCSVTANVGAYGKELFTVFIETVDQLPPKSGREMG